jgi:hypothetical protein
LTNDERDFGEIVTLRQDESFNFARDGADLGVAIAAFEITNLTHRLIAFRLRLTRRYRAQFCAV